MADEKIISQTLDQPALAVGGHDTKSDPFLGMANEIAIINHGM